jgi:4-hydroxy-L-threonine phosphate dehydrogenase PdxA
MIHVCQGHQKSISIEVFLKAALCFSQPQIDQLIFYCFRSSLENNLKLLQFDFKIMGNDLIINNRSIKCHFVTNSKYSETIECINLALKHTKNDDVLLTLPSSKDQFFYEHQNYNGHTEYLRAVFNTQDIVMGFIGPKMNILLLSDHIPLSQVSSFFDLDLVINKVEHAINQFSNLYSFKRVIFSGINPHAGEAGLLGLEDSIFISAIDNLSQKFPSISFKGPLPADTIQFNYNIDTDLIIYAYHDQGLNTFKTMNGLLGINVSFGLPFIRISPDHGTAFDIYGKNIASYQGLIYLLSKFLK